MTLSAPLSYTSPRVMDDNNCDPVPLAACQYRFALLLFLAVLVVAVNTRFSLLTVLDVFPSR